MYFILYDVNEKERLFLVRFEELFAVNDSFKDELFELKHNSDLLKRVHGRLMGKINQVRHSRKKSYASKRIMRVTGDKASLRYYGVNELSLFKKMNIYNIDPNCEHLKVINTDLLKYYYEEKNNSDAIDSIGRIESIVKKWKENGTNRVHDLYRMAAIARESLKDGITIVETYFHKMNSDPGMEIIKIVNDSNV